jgi:membrane protein implicated in regulation of membrane protease activity
MLAAWNLSSIEYFYLVCTVVGGLLFIMRAILFAVGAGHDADVDADYDLDGDFDLDGDVDHVAEPGLRLVSLQGITGFFLMFGLVGLAMSRSNIRNIWTVFGGLAAGVFTMLVIARIMLAMQNLKSDGTLRMENAVGKEGQVYLTIPEDGSGKVNIVIQGGLRELEAVSANKERIPTGETVRVLRVMSNRVLVVERIE